MLPASQVLLSIPEFNAVLAPCIEEANIILTPNSLLLSTIQNRTNPFKACVKLIGLHHTTHPSSIVLHVLQRPFLRLVPH